MSATHCQKRRTPDFNVKVTREVIRSTQPRNVLCSLLAMQACCDWVGIGRGFRGSCWLPARRACGTWPTAAAPGPCAGVHRRCRGRFWHGCSCSCKGRGQASAWRLPAEGAQRRLDHIALQPAAARPRQGGRSGWPPRRRRCKWGRQDTGGGMRRPSAAGGLLSLLRLRQAGGEALPIRCLLCPAGPAGRLVHLVLHRQLRRRAWGGLPLRRPPRRRQAPQRLQQLCRRGALLGVLRGAPQVEGRHLNGAVLGHAQRRHLAAPRRLACTRGEQGGTLHVVNGRQRWDVQLCPHACSTCHLSPKTPQEHCLAPPVQHPPVQMPCSRTPKE